MRACDGALCIPTLSHTQLRHRPDEALTVAPDRYRFYILSYIDNPGTLIREERLRAGISQASLARRAGTTQAAVSRIERGLTAPTWETVRALTLALGCEPNLSLTRLSGRWDPVHLAQLRARPPAERLALAISANRLAGRLRQAGAGA